MADILYFNFKPLSVPTFPLFTLKHPPLTICHPRRPLQSVVHASWLSNLVAEPRTLAAAWLSHVWEQAIEVRHGGTDTGLVVISPPPQWRPTLWRSSLKLVNSDDQASESADASRLSDIDAEAAAMVSVRCTRRAHAESVAELSNFSFPASHFADVLLDPEM